MAAQKMPKHSVVAAARNKFVLSSICTKKQNQSEHHKCPAAIPSVANVMRAIVVDVEKSQHLLNRCAVVAVVVSRVHVATRSVKRRSERTESRLKSWR